MNEDLYVGIDIGGTTAKIGLINKEGKIISKTEVSSTESNNWEEIVKGFIDPIEKWISEGKNIKSIGIGVPGFFNKNTGLIQNSENIPILIGVPFVEYIHNHFNIPVYADNDATVAAVAEKCFGAGKKFQNFVMVTLGTGIGGGLILNNKLYRGVTGYAGELGHMIIVPDGSECSCGNKGCIENYASASAMIKSIKKGIKKGYITSYDKNEKITAKLIFQKAEEGDPYSLQVIDTAASYLGKCLGSIINLLNVEAIIIGGGVAKAGSFFIEKVKFYTEQIAWKYFTNDIHIIQAELLNDAGLIGAAALSFYESQYNGFKKQ